MKVVHYLSHGNPKVVILYQDSNPQLYLGEDVTILREDSYPTLADLHVWTKALKDPKALELWLYLETPRTKVDDKDAYAKLKGAGLALYKRGKFYRINDIFVLQLLHLIGAENVPEPIKYFPRMDGNDCLEPCQVRGHGVMINSITCHNCMLCLGHGVSHWGEDFVYCKKIREAIGGDQGTISSS